MGERLHIIVDVLSATELCTLKWGVLCTVGLPSMTKKKIQISDAQNGDNRTGHSGREHRGGQEGLSEEVTSELRPEG